MQFSKMHGAGNDFSLFDGVNQQLPDYSALALAVCDRHFGVGGDGIMVALPSEYADIKMIYYNSDGSRGEMCGNGIRCFSRFVYEKGLVCIPVFLVETDAGPQNISLTLDGSGYVTKIAVDMGKPIFESALVPTTLTGNPVLREPLEINGQLIQVNLMRMGVPHCVILAEDIEKIELDRIGSQIEKHPAFPEKINVNFMEVTDRQHIKVRTFERGAGHTLACGTGCCSSVVAGHLLGLLDEHVFVRAEGGGVEVRLTPDYSVTLEGQAEFICDGEYSPWIMDQIHRHYMQSLSPPSPNPCG